MWYFCDRLYLFRFLCYENLFEPNLLLLSYCTGNYRSIESGAEMFETSSGYRPGAMLLEPCSYPSSPRRAAYSQRSPLSHRASTRLFFAFFDEKMFHICSILKLDECKHFHYEYVELGPVLVTLKTDEARGTSESANDSASFLWCFEVESNSKKWWAFVFWSVNSFGYKSTEIPTSQVLKNRKLDDFEKSSFVRKWYFLKFYKKWMRFSQIIQKIHNAEYRNYIFLPNQSKSGESF